MFENVKMDMKNLFYLTTILLFYSCSKNPCGNYQTKEYNGLLSDSSKAQYPFKGTDTLTYISNKGDTALLIGLWKINSIGVRNINKSGNPDCEQIDVYNNEFIQVRYSGSNSKLYSFINDVIAGTENEEYTKFRINFEDEFGTTSDFFNNTLSYNKPINIGSQTINGRNIDRNDGSASFVYNKSFGILQIKITDSLIYTLHK